MKKMTITFCSASLALALVLTTTIQANAQHMVYFNATALLLEMPEIRQIDNDVDAYRRQLTRRLEDMVRSFEEKARDIQSREQQGLLSPRQLEQLTNELGEDRTAIMQYEMEVSQKVQQRREERLKPLLNRIDETIQALAKEKGYTYILDSSTGIVLWAEDKYDITAEIRRRLGL